MDVVSVRVCDIRPQYSDLRIWISDPNNVYIGRKGIVFVTNEKGEKYRYPTSDSIWANPYKITDLCNREQSIALYKNYIIEKIRTGEINIDQLRNLKNKTLGCWCKTKQHPTTPCHGDVLIELLLLNGI